MEKELKIICPQHHERLIRDFFDRNPEEKHALVDKAEKYGGQVPIRLVTWRKEESYFNQNRNILFLSC